MGKKNDSCTCALGTRTWDKSHYYSDITAAVGHKTNQIENLMGTYAGGYWS